MSKWLLEYVDDIEDEELHYYRDAETGNIYYFNGKMLVLVPLADAGQTLSDEEIAQVEQVRQQQMEDEGVTPETPEEQEQRIAAAKQSLEKNKEQAKRESTQAVMQGQKNKRLQQARKAKTKSGNNLGTIEEFEKLIIDFIGGQIEKFERSASWGAYNGKFHNTNIMMPGRKKHRIPEQGIKRGGKHPTINVYFDQSGSWGPKDIRVGNSFLAGLEDWQDRGLVDIQKYYFDTRVKDNPNNLGGGTLGAPVLRHIELTKPDNVIIMTDSDISDCSKPVVISGGVWMLFRNGYVSENLKKHLSGMKMTRYFKF